MSGSDGQSDDAVTVTDAVREVGDHPIVEGGARLGYAVNGLLHLLIAWLAVQVALGVRAARADQSGALATLTNSNLGTLTLWAAVVGFALLAMWQITEAVVRRKRSVKIKSVGKTIVYAAIGWSAVGFLRGSGSDSSTQSVEIAGDIAKGIALAFVAILFLIAAVTGTPDEATGLDGAMRKLTELPGGSLPLLVIAVGFAAYGVYSLARARFVRV